MGERGEREKRVGPVMRLFLLLFALAGLGLGVWLFGRRRAGAPREFDEGAP